jgi:small subunit ribosomal protein S4
VDVDPKKLTGLFRNAPERSELGTDIREQLVVELYSK